MADAENSTNIPSITINKIKEAILQWSTGQYSDLTPTLTVEAVVQSVLIADQLSMAITVKPFFSDHETAYYTATKVPAMSEKEVREAVDAAISQLKIEQNSAKGVPFISIDDKGNIHVTKTNKVFYKLDRGEMASFLLQLKTS